MAYEPWQIGQIVPVYSMVRPQEEEPYDVRRTAAVPTGECDALSARQERRRYFDLQKRTNWSLQTRLEGLFVSDGSVLLVAPGLPLILTIVALAKRLSHQLVP